MADETEITVTIPESDEETTDAEEISTGIEIGQAIEQAADAEEHAEIAEISADTAMDMAGVAAETAYATAEQVAAQEEIIGAQSARINELMTTVAGLVDITNNLTALALAEHEKEEFQELPPDETPANQHWLNKELKLF